MPKNLTIILLDDFEPSNVLHKRLVEKHIANADVHTFTDPFKTLEAMNEADPSQRLVPDIIFLDINMNSLDGWDFLKIYSKMEIVQNPDVKVVLLSHSDDPDIPEKARHIKFIKHFLFKPLTEETLKSIL